MIVSIKMRTIAIIAAALILVAGIVSAVTISAAARTTNGKTVVLDAGHGGMDGGVVGSVTKTKESDINLAITRATKQYLEDAGYNVVLTRKNSEGLYSAGDKNKKLSDLARRRDIIREAKPDLMVSIHQNFYPLSSVSGAQSFYAPSSDISKTYADSIQNMLNSGTNGRRVAMKGDYYILQCSEYPSVLVECGFLSNASEEQLLVSSEYQKKMAYLIFSAIHGILLNGQSQSDLLF